MKILKSHIELVVFQLAFKTSMEIFAKTGSFPREEVYSLTSQILRSSAQCLQTLLKPSGKEDMKKLLLQNFLIQNPKLVKRRFGSITPMNVDTYLKTIIPDYFKNMTK